MRRWTLFLPPDPTTSLPEGLGLEHLSSGDQTLKAPFAGAIKQDYQKGSDEE